MTILTQKSVSGRPLNRILDQKQRAVSKRKYASVTRKEFTPRRWSSPVPLADIRLLGISLPSSANSSCVDVVMRDDIDSFQDHQEVIPIHALPFEILSDIFMKYLEDEPRRRKLPRFSERWPCVSPNTSADPMVLGQVCSYWRNVALATPTLWTSIFIKHPTFTQLTRTRLWLQRAQPLGVNITLEGSPKPSNMELSASRSLLDIFVSYMHSWKNIAVLCSSDVLLCQESYGSCPNLETAIMQITLSEQFVDADHSFEVVDKLWQAVHASPSLHRVHWGDTYSDALPAHAPWGQLTSVDIETPLDLEELLDIMRACHSAHTITIANLSEPLPDFKTPSPIVLPTLQKLSVVMSQPTSDAFFSSFTLPSLKSLSLLHYDPEGSFHYPTAFRDFLARSQCHLKSFEFIDECLSDSDLLGYLTSPYLQNVKQLGLDIRGSNISNKVVSAFTRNPATGNQGLMPNLRSIELAVCCTDDGVISQMVASRQQAMVTDDGSKPSRSLSFASFLVQSETGHPTDCNALEDLSAEGLDWKLGFLQDRTGLPSIPLP